MRNVARIPTRLAHRAIATFGNARDEEADATFLADGIIRL